MKFATLRREERFDRGRSDREAATGELEGRVIDVTCRNRAETLTTRAEVMSYFMSSGQEHLLPGRTEQGISDR